MVSNNANPNYGLSPDAIARINAGAAQQRPLPPDPNEVNARTSRGALQATKTVVSFNIGTVFAARAGGPAGAGPAPSITAQVSAAAARALPQPPTDSYQSLPTGELSSSLHPNLLPDYTSVPTGTQTPGTSPYGASPAPLGAGGNQPDNSDDSLDSPPSLPRGPLPPPMPGVLHPGAAGHPLRAPPQRGNAPPPSPHGRLPPPMSGPQNAPHLAGSPPPKPPRKAGGLPTPNNNIAGFQAAMGTTPQDRTAAATKYNTPSPIQHSVKNTTQYIQKLEAEHNSPNTHPARKQQIASDLKRERKQLIGAVQQEIAALTKKLYNSRINNSKTAFEKNQKAMHELMSNAQKAGIGPAVRAAKAESDKQLDKAFLVSFENRITSADHDFKAVREYGEKTNTRSAGDALVKYAEQLKELESQINRLPKNLQAGLQEHIQEARQNIKNELARNIASLRSDLKTSTGKNAVKWNQTAAAIGSWRGIMKDLTDKAGLTEDPQIGKAWKQLKGGLDSSAKAHYKFIKNAKYTDEPGQLLQKNRKYAMVQFNDALKSLPKSDVREQLHNESSTEISRINLLWGV